MFFQTSLKLYHQNRNRFRRDYTNSPIQIVIFHIFLLEYTEIVIFIHVLSRPP